MLPHNALDVKKMLGLKHTPPMPTCKDQCESPTLKNRVAYYTGKTGLKNYAGPNPNNGLPNNAKISIEPPSSERNRLVHFDTDFECANLDLVK